MDVKRTLCHDDYIRLLEEKKFDELFEDCRQYIKEKVDAYLQNFTHYKQYKKDFLHEVYIHILTKSLPSQAFLQACKQGNTFRFYLAKSVKNCLNTLLAREKNKKQNLVGIETLYLNAENEYAEDRSLCLMDKSYKEQTEAQDILNRLKNKFEQFLQDFLETFPKIAYKLILLLKLQARAIIHIQDLKNCFTHIKNKDVGNFLHLLGSEESYKQLEDKDIYELACPYFQKYRREKGSPSALQRWLNQHITGDKFSKGIIDRLEIREKEQVYKIQDKKLFADFMFEYFKSVEEQKVMPQLEPAQENVILFEPIQLSVLSAVTGS